MKVYILSILLALTGLGSASTALLDAVCINTIEDCSASAIVVEGQGVGYGPNPPQGTFDIIATADGHCGNCGCPLEECVKVSDGSFSAYWDITASGGWYMYHESGTVGQETMSWEYHSGGESLACPSVKDVLLCHSLNSPTLGQWVQMSEDDKGSQMFRLVLGCGDCIGECDY